MLSGSSRRAKGAKTLAGLAVAVFAVGMLGLVPASAATRAAATTCADPSGTVKIGASYFGNVGAAYSSIGGDSTASPADQAVIDGYQKGIDALNAAGGLAGCQVKLEVFNFSAQGDFNQESQAECAKFTQDNKVVAVYQGADETKVAMDCYFKAKTPFFAQGGSFQPACKDLQKYSAYVYFPPGVSTCRYGAFIGMWKKAGLFPKGSKVGILAMDDGSGDGQFLANDVYTPALKKAGIPVEVSTYHGSTSTADFAQTNATLAPAILKFKTDGVNVVLFTPAGAQGVAAFMPQAVNQGYFPSYGITSADGFLVSSALGGSAIKTGLGVSWYTGDLPLTTQQALPANTSIESCAKWSPANPAGITGASTFCDFINQLETVFKGATKTDAATLAAGMNALGTSFVSSVTYGGATKFGKNQHGGNVAMAKMVKFDPNSKSWDLISPTEKAVPIP